jgi:hypothetical protein
VSLQRCDTLGTKPRACAAPTSRRGIVWVDAGERRKFERHLRHQLKDALDAAGIEMPNHQVDVWMRGVAAAA